METPTSQRPGQSDYIDIPSWVNGPYERRKAQEKERLLQEAKEQRIQHASQQRNYQGRRLERQPETDTFTRTRSNRTKRGKRAKKSGIPAALAALSGVGATIGLILSLNAPKALNNDKPMPETRPIGVVSATRLNDTQPYDYENNTFYNDHGKLSASTLSQGISDYEEYDYEEPIQYEDETYEAPSNYCSEIEEEYIGSGYTFLEELNQLSGVAVDNYYKLCDALDMTEEETADYLTQLCESENWANGVTYPSLFLAQISRESKFNPYAVGDGGLAIGLGQFHTCAVDEVNNRYHTNYTYEDRKDPIKALEMMALLLRYDYSQTKSTYGMLAMYNQGHPCLDTEEGQNYVRNVLGEIGMPMA